MTVSARTEANDRINAVREALIIGTACVMRAEHSNRAGRQAEAARLLLELSGVAKDRVTELVGAQPGV